MTPSLLNFQNKSFRAFFFSALQTPLYIGKVKIARLLIKELTSSMSFIDLANWGGKLRRPFSVFVNTT